METAEDVYGLLFFVVVLIQIIAMWRIFQKAGEYGWLSIIPVANIFILLKIAGKPMWWFILLLIPFVNLIFYIMILHGLSTSFGNGAGVTIGLLFLPPLFFPVLAFGSSQHISKRTMHSQQQPGAGYGTPQGYRPQEQHSQPPSAEVHTDTAGAAASTPARKPEKPPTILSDLIQPGLVGKIFTIFFKEEGMVFVKTGSGSTNASGSMRAALGGAGPAATIMSGFGKVLDMANADKRGDYLGQVGGYDVNSLLSQHKLNFYVPYGMVERVELKGPSMMGEMKVKVFAGGQEHKFRVDTRSDSIARMFFNTFNEHCPGKVIKQ
ncbi:MAG: DUF5684 domain-containing protein [Ignavibacteriaceae bacterium]|nr:DUF5684 domain-containing protein [Ignavibacteriaceae bacterium]